MERGLTDQNCVTTASGLRALSAPEVQQYLTELRCSWDVEGTRAIRHTFTFKDFDEAMFFVNEVAAVSEGENHHPDIHISFKQVVIELSTHDVGGLSINDFILASKIETCDA